VLSNPGGMPGGNRNAGVRGAVSEWIAFLDAGIVPEADWLENLKKCAETAGSKAVFGVCQFHADGAVERAVCALSYGYLARQSVLPASLFHREVFERTGFFDERLRAAEDILWIRQLGVAGVKRETCETACVHYHEFPRNPCEAMRKWYVAEQNAVWAGVRPAQHFLYPVLALAGIALVALHPMAGFAAAVAYLVARGIAEPIRRSRDLFWWRGAGTAFLVAIAIALCLDLAKTTAILSATFRGNNAGGVL